MAKDTDKKVKRPTAEKRVIQDQKRQATRKSFKSKAATAIRTFMTSLKDKDEPSILKEKLQTIYSLMDKGMKKHIYKKNKAARVKSKMTQKLTDKA